MHERYGRNAHQAVDPVVPHARAREVELVANMPTGAASSVFEKQVKEASVDEGSRQVAEN